MLKTFFKKNLVERKKVVLLQPRSAREEESRGELGGPEAGGSRNWERRTEAPLRERGAGSPVKEFIEIL